MWTLTRQWTTAMIMCRSLFFSKEPEITLRHYSGQHRMATSTNLGVIMTFAFIRSQLDSTHCSSLTEGAHHAKGHAQGSHGGSA